MSALSASSLSDRVAHLTADPVLAGHPVVGELVERLGVLDAEPPPPEPVVHYSRDVGFVAGKVHPDTVEDAGYLDRL